MRENVVYVIKCRTCNKVFIGETGRRLVDTDLKFRLTWLPDTDLSADRHFASPGHNVGDMLVSVIRFGFISATERRSFEARMRFRHRTLDTAGLNVDFNFI